MTFTRSHLRLTMGGNAFTSEEWQVGFRLVPQTPVDAGAPFLQTLAEAQIGAFATAIGTWAATARSTLWSVNHFLSWIKLAPIAPNGVQAPGNTPYAQLANIQGTGLSWAAQNAVVASLLTSQNRGRAHRGRVYWPGRQLAIDTSGALAGSECTAVAAATADLVTALNAVSTETVLRVAVMSDLAGGTTNQVTAVTVGNIPDTQRRRRNGLAEVYSTPDAV